MRLPDSAHTSRPWRIHELTRDFRLEDVWALPTPAARTTSPGWCDDGLDATPRRAPPRAVRALFAIRWKVGELLGWDRPDAGLGSRVPTLRDRLPADLRDGPVRPGLRRAPLHLAVPDSTTSGRRRSPTGPCTASCTSAGSRTTAGGYRGQMAVLVKPNGLLGTAYMAAIRPFRHLIVYPLMMREFGRGWRG